jgi:hypothetical protein
MPPTPTNATCSTCLILIYFITLFLITSHNWYSQTGLSKSCTKQLTNGHFEKLRHIKRPMQSLIHPQPFTLHCLYMRQEIYCNIVIALDWKGGCEPVTWTANICDYCARPFHFLHIMRCRQYKGQIHHFASVLIFTDGL